LTELGEGFDLGEGVFDMFDFFGALNGSFGFAEIYM
jgi:hypothetical protein